MFIDIDGVNTHYICEGDGICILLLHGWGTGIKPFEALIEHLSPYYKVYALDFPGFCESEEPQTAWGVDEYAHFLLQFCQKLNISETFLLGHSMGGRIAIKMLSEKNCPIKVKKLILTGSAGIRPKRSAKSKFKTRLYKIGKVFLSAKPVEKLFPDALEKLRSKNGSADYRAASPIMRQCLVKMVNTDLTELLPSIKASTLLIWGVNDAETPISDGILMEKLIPDAGLVRIDNAGHFAFLDQWYTFSRVVDSFLNIK